MRSSGTQLPVYGKDVLELADDLAAIYRSAFRRAGLRRAAGLPDRRAMLTTYRDDRPAPRLYRRSGWRLLFPGLDASSDLYGLELPYVRPSR